MIEAGKLLQQRYRIDKKIGQGGMGAVYIATYERFDSTVAIKETLCMDDNFRKAIEREARLLNSLKHTALPRVSDHFEEDDGLFLVMEFIPGEDVAAMLENDEVEFSIEQVLKWADQLLDALDYLHNQETPVVHRDIKPQNLKVTSRSEIILLDFGLAKGNPTDAGHQTAAKSIFGYSRNYASLEQIQGTGTDPRSDLYSLAATLYHLLTKRPPEDALTRAMSVLSNRPDPLIPANDIVPDVPRGLAGVLQKALALNADERPSSAIAMRQMLNESDEYGYLVDPATISTKAEGHVAGRHSTIAVPHTTRAEAVDHTEAKTQVLPSELSQATSLRFSANGPLGETIPGSGNTTFSRAMRGWRAVGASFAVLCMIAGGLAGGVYFYDPSIIGLSPTQQIADQEWGPSDPNVTDESGATDTENINGVASNGVTSDEPIAQNSSRQPSSSSETQRDTSSSGKVEERAARDGNSTSNKSRPAADPDDLEVNTTDVPGEVVITRTENGKQIVTKISPNRPHPPPRQGRFPNQGDFLPPDFDPSKLTPEQRRKLNEAMRRLQKTRPKPPPANQLRPE